MLRRVISVVLLVWLFGFAWFAMTLPGSAGAAKTDAVIVYTGGPGRIARGLEVVREKWSPMLLVSGVDREVRPEEFEAEYDVPRDLMDCCVTLGFESYDTRSNAIETVRWLARRDDRSVRLVTTDWHMRRAVFDLEQELPAHISIVPDGVASVPSLKTLFLEYNKYLVRRVTALWTG